EGKHRLQKLFGSTHPIGALAPIANKFRVALLPKDVFPNSDPTRHMRLSVRIPLLTRDKQKQTRRRAERALGSTRIWIGSAQSVVEGLQPLPLCESLLLRPAGPG